MLLPAASPRDTDELLKTVRSALSITSTLFREIGDAIHPPSAGSGRSSKRAREAASELRAITLPLDLSGMDLTDATTVHLEDLDQAVWTDSTKWPDPETAHQVRAASEEIAPGIYQVQTGSEQARLGMPLPG